MSQQWPPPGWHPPGWYPYPPDPPSERWWDGTQWTARVRRRADRDTWTTLLLIALAGLVVVVLGGVLWTRLVWSDYSSNDPASSACSGQTLVSGIAPLWLPWLVLVGLAAWATVVGRRQSLGDWRVNVFVLSVWAVVAVTCPVLTILLGGMNCGL